MKDFCYVKHVPDNLEPASARFKPVLLRRKGVALALWGEAGIGKTYQAQILLQSVPCQSVSVHANTSWATLAGSLAVAKKTPLWAEQTLARAKRGEAVDTQPFLDAFTAILAVLAPIIFQVEDLHEANPERLEFWKSLAQTVTRLKGVGMFVTSRTEPPAPFERFRLGPLTKEMSDTLLTNEVGASLPEEALEWIYSKAAGNPLYTLEYLRFLSRQGFFWSDGKRWHWRVPESHLMPVTVEALLELTLENAGGEAKKTLQAKAYLPLEASNDLIQNVAGLSAAALEKAKLDLGQRGIFANGNFAHPLYREVTLKHLPKLERQALARRTLAALREQPVQAALFVADAALKDAEALELLQQGASVATASGDSVGAARLQAQATHYASGEARGLLALQAAKVLQNHDMRSATKLAELALESELPEAVELLAEVEARGQRKVDLTSLRERLTPKLQTLVDWRRLEFKVHYLSEDHAKVTELYETHSNLVKTLPGLKSMVASSLLAVGKNDQARQLLGEALQQTTLSIPERCDLLRLQALIQFSEGRYQESEESYEALLPLARNALPARLLSSLLLNRAANLKYLGRYDEMVTCLGESLELRRNLGDPKTYAFALTALSELLIERGEHEKAEDNLREALSTFRLYPPSRFLVNTEIMASFLYNVMPTALAPTMAVHHAESALRLARELHSPRLVAEILPDAALANIRAGNVELARRQATEALALLPTAGDDPVYHWRTLTALALVEERTDVSKARVLFQEALELAESVKSFLDAHKIGLELDRLNHDAATARKRMHWFEERGLFSGVYIAQRYFPELAKQATTREAMNNVPRLDVLGVMQLYHNGHTSNVRGRKRQEFLAMLLEARIAGRTEVSRLDLFDALYSDSDEEKALGNLKQLVHSLRLELGESSVVTTATGYALGGMTSDAETFLQTLDTSLWRGCYLQGSDLTTQESLAESLYIVLFEKAKGLLEANPKEAARVARILLEADPYNADYLTFTLQALRQSGNHRSLGRVYEEAKHHFAEVGETLPESWTAFLSH